MSHEPERLIDERIAAFVDDCMSDKERDRFVAELRVSPQLQRDLDEYERTVDTVRRALGAETVQVDVAGRVMEALAQEATGGAVRELPRSGTRMLFSLVAAAALLALAVWIDAVAGRTEPTTDSTAHTDSPSAKAPASATAPLPVTVTSSSEGLAAGRDGGIGLGGGATIEYDASKGQVGKGAASQGAASQGEAERQGEQRQLADPGVLLLEQALRAGSTAEQPNAKMSMKQVVQDPAAGQANGVSETPSPLTRQVATPAETMLVKGATQKEAGVAAVDELRGRRESNLRSRGRGGAKTPPPSTGSDDFYLGSGADREAKAGAVERERGGRDNGVGFDLEAPPLPSLTITWVPQPADKTKTADRKVADMRPESTPAPAAPKPSGPSSPKAGGPGTGPATGGLIGGAAGGPAGQAGEPAARKSGQPRRSLQLGAFVAEQFADNRQPEAATAMHVWTTATPAPPALPVFQFSGLDTLQWSELPAVPVVGQQAELTRAPESRQEPERDADGVVDARPALERRWLVEGRRDEIASLMQRLAELAQQRGYQLAQGELPVPLFFYQPKAESADGRRGKVASEKAAPEQAAPENVAIEKMAREKVAEEEAAERQDPAAEDPAGDKKPSPGERRARLVLRFQTVPRK